MDALLGWLPTNGKPLGLVIFFVTFCLIVLYVFGGARRERLEAHKHIPFLDDDRTHDGH